MEIFRTGAETESFGGNIYESYCTCASIMDCLFLSSIIVVALMRRMKYRSASTMVNSALPAVANQIYEEKEITTQDTEPVTEAGNLYQKLK